MTVRRTRPSLQPRGEELCFTARDSFANEATVDDRVRWSMGNPGRCMPCELVEVGSVTRFGPGACERLRQADHAAKIGRVVARRQHAPLVPVAELRYRSGRGAESCGE